MSTEKVHANNGKAAQAAKLKPPSEEARRWHVMRLLCRAIALDSALQAHKNKRQVE